LYVPFSTSVSTRCGRTRVDILAVCLLFAILTAIVVPGIQVLRELNARLHCSHNLSQIGQAYHRFLDADKDGKGKTFKSDGWWISQLKKFVRGGDAYAFSCPNESARSTTIPDLKLFGRENQWPKNGDAFIIPFSEVGSSVRIRKSGDDFPDRVLEFKDPSDGNWDRIEMTINVKSKSDGSIESDSKISKCRKIRWPHSCPRHAAYTSGLASKSGRCLSLTVISPPLSGVYLAKNAAPSGSSNSSQTVDTSSRSSILSTSTGNPARLLVLARYARLASNAISSIWRFET